MNNYSLYRLDEITLALTYYKQALIDNDEEGEIELSKVLREDIKWLGDCLKEEDVNQIICRDNC